MATSTKPVLKATIPSGKPETSHVHVHHLHLDDRILYVSQPTQILDHRLKGSKPTHVPASIKRIQRVMVKRKPKHQAVQVGITKSAF